MFRGLLTAAVAITIASAALHFVAKPARAADLAVRHVARTHHWRWHDRCPDRLSCYPLYGAYGPWGGAGYWGGYGFYAYNYSDSR